MELFTRMDVLSLPVVVIRGVINSLKLKPRRRKTEMKTGPPNMTIFDLPDPFLCELMKKMEIKDRLRLRLTCRSFENLVARTHAGHFDLGFICFYYNPNRKFKTFLSMRIGDVQFTDVRLTEIELSKFMHLRSRLFSGITLNICRFSLIDNSATPELLHQLTLNFSIELIDICISTENGFENSVQLMEDFPRSKYRMIIKGKFVPEYDQLLSLPPLEELRISDGQIQIEETSADWSPRPISTELLFKLISSHKDLSLTYVSITSEDLKHVMQILSDDVRDRTVQLFVKHWQIERWLEEYEIGRNATDGQFCGEALQFEVLHIERRRFYDLTFLRFRSCWILFDGTPFSDRWHNAGLRSGVTITNFKPEGNTRWKFT